VVSRQEVLTLAKSVVDQRAGSGTGGALDLEDVRTAARKVVSGQKSVLGLGEAGQQTPMLFDRRRFARSPEQQSAASLCADLWGLMNATISLCFRTSSWISDELRFLFQCLDASSQFSHHLKAIPTSFPPGPR
jgi:hypothetical protein